MMMSEFVERTGFEPTAEEYAEIENAYYEFDGDKNAFCLAFVAGDGEKKVCQARIARIEELKSKIVELDKAAKEAAKASEKRIADLQAQLDRELEWKPCDTCGTNLSQDRYEDLLKECSGQHGDPHVMSEDEAKRLVAEEFGFDPARIVIQQTVDTYEVNKHHRLRKAATFTRQPLYDATDYNYVRFNVRGAGSTWMYEMVDGELREYCC